MMLLVPRVSSASTTAGPSSSRRPVTSLSAEDQLPSSDRERNCLELLTQHRSFIVHDSGLLWCPAAKVGSSSIFSALQLNYKHRNALKTAAKLSAAQKQELCRRKHFTFTMHALLPTPLAPSHLRSLTGLRLAAGRETRSTASHPRTSTRLPSPDLGDHV